MTPPDEDFGIGVVDPQGRRYLEVQIASPRCIECGSTIHHGDERYYQRTEAHDADFVVLRRVYAFVCGPCGDQLLGRPPIA